MNPLHSLSLLVLVAPLLAQGVPTMVRDLHTAPATGYSFGTIRAAALAGSFTCFVSDDGGALTKVWRTDGTSAGTTLLAAIDAYAAEDLEMVARNGLVFFTAPSLGSGVELWTSDGTPAGTSLLDLNPGPASSSPHRLTVDLHTTATSVYFSAIDATAGREPWVTDGTAAGTRRLGNIAAGTASSMLPSDEFQPASSTVYFAATNGTTGRELWRYDRGGAPVFHADIVPGAGSSNPHGFVAAMSDLMFVANGASGAEVYRLNGTTLTLIDVWPGTAASRPGELILHYPQTGSRYCFFAADGGNGMGRELWRYNLLTGALNPYDLLPGSAHSNPDLLKLGNYVLATAGANGARALFSVPVSSTTATLLPTVTGTVVFQTAAFPSPPTALVAILSPSQGSGLYHTNGTVAGTVAEGYLGLEPMAPLPGGTSVLAQAGLVIDNQPAATPMFGLVPQLGLTADSNPHRLTPMPDGSLVFGAFTPLRALWRCDGTAVGTQQIGPAPHSALSPLLGGRRYYVAQQAPGLGQLVATDGTAAGTQVLVGNLPISATHGANVTFTVLGTRLLLHWPDQLLVTDGTAAGTSVLLQWPTYGLNRGAVVGGAYCFFHETAAHGRELWRSDGTAAGTTLLADVNPGPASGIGPGSSGPNPMQLLADAGILLFLGDDGVHGQELWRTDGTTAGTQLVVDMLPGAGSGIDWIVSDDERAPVLLHGRSFASGLEPFATDGTNPGTVLLADATPGPANSQHVRFVGRIGTQTLFTAHDSGLGGQLWRTRGTPATTAAVLSTPVAFGPGVPVGTRLVFPVEDNLWVTDATVSGTHWLAAGNQAFGIPQGSRLLRQASTTTTGRELGRTDGTLPGTLLHADLWPGTGESYPTDFVLAGNKVFFVADDGIHGKELWVMDSMAGVLPSGAACAGSNGLPAIRATTPQLGTTFDVTLTNALGNAPAVLLLGLAAADQPLGGGCTQLVSTTAPHASLFVVTSSLGAANVATAIPNHPSFTGLMLHCQYGVLDPAGALLGLAAFTSAVTGLVGL